jgi:cbb3-type cytochrome oxidase maturation protein
MNVIIILLGASLSVALFFLLAFMWSVKNGQFEDDFSPAHRILFDDKKERSKEATDTNSTI